MKPSTLNNLGKKYLVEDCEKIRIDHVIRQVKKEVQKTVITAVAVVDGFEVKLTSHKLHHGGDRLWFVCPICRLPAGLIYRHPVQYDLVGCRRCLGLDYRSRRFKGMVENGL